MIILETNFLKITQLSDQIVYVEAQSGIEVTGAIAVHSNQVIEAAMPGKYGMIINRNRDYSVDIVPVYKALNETENLKAIAIVSQRDLTRVMAETEKMLFNGSLELFGSVDVATDWLNKILPAL